MEMGEAVAKMNRLREGNRWEKSERQGGERERQKKKEMEEPTRQAVGAPEKGGAGEAETEAEGGEGRRSRGTDREVRVRG